MAISPPQPPLGALRAAVDDAVARLPDRQRRVPAMVEGEGARCPHPGAYATPGDGELDLCVVDPPC
jgi:hypothetical protein